MPTTLLGPPRPKTGAVTVQVTPTLGPPFTAEVWPVAPSAPVGIEVDAAVANGPRVKWWAADTVWAVRGLANGDTLVIAAGNAWSGSYTVERVDTADPEAPEAILVRRA